MNAIQIHHAQDVAQIEFTSPVTSAAIYALTQAIEQALHYFQYSTVEIFISSQGGESAAARYYFEQLSQWDKSGVTIRTTARTECASAAALLLSLGSRGHRRASLSSRLVYHRPRVEAGPTLSREIKKIEGILTAVSGAAVIRRLEQLERTIQREDEHLHGLINCHVSPENPESAAWFADERLRRAHVLTNNRDALLSAANRGSVPLDDKDAGRLSDAIAALAAPSLSDGDAFEVLQVVFEAVLDDDRPISPLLAWSLLLIDQVDGLDLGRPTLGGAQ